MLQIITFHSSLTHALYESSGLQQIWDLIYCNLTCLVFFVIQWVLFLVSCPIQGEKGSPKIRGTLKTRLTFAFFLLCSHEQGFYSGANVRAAMFPSFSIQFSLRQKMENVWFMVLLFVDLQNLKEPKNRVPSVQVREGA